MTDDESGVAAMSTTRASTVAARAWAASLLVGAMLAGAAGVSRAEGPERVLEPAAGTPDHVVSRALVAATTEDEPAAFQAYLELVHPDRRATPEAVEQLRRYSWKRFRKQASDYILAGTDGGFVLARRDPGRLTPETTHVRLFVQPVNHPGRLDPTPIRLERAGEPARWLITANSL
jgi:hypothetical protein